MKKVMDLGGLRFVGEVYDNLSTAALYERIIIRSEARLSRSGPIVVRTGQYTGRSPHDKYIVRDESNAELIWWTPSNRPFDREHFRALEARLAAYMQGRDTFIQDCYVGADPQYRLPVRIITEKAWHSQFARNLFIRENNRRKLARFKPEFYVIAVPGFQANPEIDGTRSEAFSIADFEGRKVIIGGTSYAGEIKKSLFTVMNYLMPQREVLGMHCSANLGRNKDTALFFGLSGTGKTTLSSDPDRFLIGDDEHGWSENGIFNFEGGCYAKTINLSPEAEPIIWEMTHKFGTVLENVIMDPDTRLLDFDDGSLTANTRAGYSLLEVPGAVPSGCGGHPKTIIMLTCDAFGVMPPIAKMTSAQAMYHFISGYTAKVAGTERGVTEPQATFSACFGAPFMALHPTVYADMLGEKIEKHQVDCYLINTGWTAGPFGAGHRLPIAQTRAMVSAAIEGKLADVPAHPDPIFKVLVPESCPGVPAEVLQPRQTWSNKRAYTAQARQLVGLFAKNFEGYSAKASKEVRNAGPKMA